jgi:hypothetical protein
MEMNQIIRAKPTIFEGIEYRSRLEASFAEWMTEHDCPFEYLDSMICIGREGYAPDFASIGYGYDENRYVEIRTWIETKPIRFHSEAWLAIRAVQETKENLMVIDSPDRGQFQCFAIVWGGELVFFTSDERLMLDVAVSGFNCPIAIPSKPRKGGRLW